MDADKYIEGKVSKVGWWILVVVGSWRLKYSTAGGQVLGCFCRDLGALTGSNLILPEGEDEQYRHPVYILGGGYHLRNFRHDSLSEFFAYKTK